MAEDLWRQGAADLAGLIRTRAVTSREVIEAHLERIGAVNGSLNAVTVTLSDSALEAADRADAAIAAGEDPPLLHGVLAYRQRPAGGDREPVGCLPHAGRFERG